MARTLADRACAQARAKTTARIQAETLMADLRALDDGLTAAAEQIADMRRRLARMRAHAAAQLIMLTEAAPPSRAPFVPISEAAADVLQRVLENMSAREREGLDRLIAAKLAEARRESGHDASPIRAVE